MNAADLLRQAIKDAPDGLNVDVDGAGDLNIWTGRWTNALVLGGDERDAVMRLIGLLLAAAPHLADLLDPQGTPTADVIEHMRDAIEGAAR